MGTVGAGLDISAADVLACSFKGDLCLADALVDGGLVGEGAAEVGEVTGKQADQDLQFSTHQEGFEVSGSEAGRGRLVQAGEGERGAVTISKPAQCAAQRFGHGGCRQEVIATGADAGVEPGGQVGEVAHLQLRRVRPSSSAVPRM